MNVVVIVVDALRAADVGHLGRSDEITPHLDALAEKSLTFENAFSLSNKTDISMSSILSGNAPREHGVIHHGTVHTDKNLARIRERSPTFLPEILAEHGYDNIGVDWMGRWHEWGYDTYGVESGGRNIEATPDSLSGKAFDLLTDVVLELPDPMLSPILKQYYRWTGYDDYRVDCEGLTDIALERMGAADSPFFTLVHYWDVHPPYLPPDEYQNEFDHSEMDEPLDTYFGGDGKGPLAAEFQPYARGEHTTVGESKEAYDGAVRWVDEQLGRMIDYLETEDIMDETMVIVTADHGHNFGEHGIFSDNTSLYDTSVHVPLVVHHPERDHERVSGIVQHTDIVPTILDALDIDQPTSLRGNVLPETRDYAFAEAVEGRMLMIRTDRWKLLVPQDVDYYGQQHWYDGDGEPELYDLTADPGETTNVATDHPGVVERLRETLQDELRAQEQAARDDDQRSANIDDEDLDDIKARLGALGYADDDHV